MDDVGVGIVVDHIEDEDLSILTTDTGNLLR